MFSPVWYFGIYLHGLSLNGWHDLLCIANNRHDVTITTQAIKRHFLIWMRTVRQPTKLRCSCVLTSEYTFICVYWWTRQWIHNTLIVVDRCMRVSWVYGTSARCLRSICLAHPGVRESWAGFLKLLVSYTWMSPGVDLSKPRHETAFGNVTMAQWHYN